MPTYFLSRLDYSDVCIDQLEAWKMVYERVSGEGREKLLSLYLKVSGFFPLFCDTDTWILNNI